MRGFLDQILKRLGLNSDRPPFEGLYIYIVLLLVAYFLGDLMQLSVQNSLLPTFAKKVQGSARSMTVAGRNPNYTEILRRNIFNSDGVIPPALSELAGEEPADEGPAVPSNLPLRLIGTIVHANPAKSVATIELRNINQVLTFGQDEEIEKVGAKITSIERLKVIFRNQQNNRLEYIEIKETFPINFGARRESPVATAGTRNTGEDIVQTSDNKFSVSRSVIKKYLNNLPELLQQARAVPNIDPATGGINGFRILDIAPGSIFEKLGIRRHDIVKSVNGTVVDSPAKAMELLNALRDSDNVNLGVERNGRTEDINYGVTQ